MGANIQFVFYRNSSGEIILKAMLNEKDMKLPLEEYAPGFYRWDDFRAYYTEHCKAVFEMLDRTENIDY